MAQRHLTGVGHAVSACLLIPSLYFSCSLTIWFALFKQKRSVQAIGPLPEEHPPALTSLLAVLVVLSLHMDCHKGRLKIRWCLMGCLFSPSFAVRSRQQSLGAGWGEGSGEGGEGLFQEKHIFFFFFNFSLFIAASGQLHHAGSSLCCAGFS